MACCCWDGIFMGDYFHPQTSLHLQKMRVSVCADMLVWAVLSSRHQCVVCVCVFLLVGVRLCFCACLHPSVTFPVPGKVKSSTHCRRYSGQYGTPYERWDERQAEWETDREGNNEIDGSHEVMTAGCPRSLMDDKCSVSMSVSVAAHLCQYGTS